MTKTNLCTELNTVLKAADIMTSPVISVNMWDSIHDVAKVFIDNNISGAPVVDREGIPLGVITKTDLARYDLERANLITFEKDKKSPVALKTSESVNRKGFHVEPEEATIEPWMTPFIFDVHADTKISVVTEKMVKYGFHHIFVTNKETKFVEGIITTFDLLKVLNRTLNEKVRIPQIKNKNQ